MCWLVSWTFSFPVTCTQAEFSPGLRLVKLESILSPVCHQLAGTQIRSHICHRMAKGYLRGCSVLGFGKHGVPLIVWDGHFPFKDLSFREKEVEVIAPTSPHSKKSYGGSAGLLTFRVKKKPAHLLQASVSLSLKWGQWWGFKLTGENILGNYRDLCSWRGL